MPEQNQAKERQFDEILILEKDKAGNLDSYDRRFCINGMVRLRSSLARLQ